MKDLINREQLVKCCSMTSLKSSCWALWLKLLNAKIQLFIHASSGWTLMLPVLQKYFFLNLFKKWQSVCIQEQSRTNRRDEDCDYTAVKGQGVLWTHLDGMFLFEVFIAVHWSHSEGAVKPCHDRGQEKSIHAHSGWVYTETGGRI